ncbi:MAG: creatininase family protein [Synechococcaceae cyanobacterium]|nr:creatininase family protein [Synechococcaceae cyanobacterium]
MPPSSSMRRLEHLSWPAVRAGAARPGSTVIWPFGAIEQHGPQLPLGTDALFADRVCEAVLERLDPALPIWRLPLQSLGFSAEHRGFPGTLSLGAELMLALVQQVGADLAGAGFQRLVLFNAHGGQIGLLDAAARSLRDRHPRLAVLPCFLWRGLEGFQELVGEPEASHGLHAGRAETSLMLHLSPDLTGPQRQADGPDLAAIPDGWSLEGAAPCTWRTLELSASGVVGDPDGASAALGEALFQRLVQGWERRFDALLRSDWPPTAGPG